MKGVCGCCCSAESSVDVVEEPGKQREFIPGINRSIGSFSDPIGYLELQQRVGQLASDMFSSGRYCEADLDLIANILIPEAYAKEPARQLVNNINWKINETRSWYTGIVHEYKVIFYDVLQRSLDEQLISPEGLAEELEELSAKARIKAEIVWLKQDQNNRVPELLYETLEKIAIVLNHSSLS